MNYHTIDGGDIEEDFHFFTFQTLINLAKKYPNKVFKFLGTDYSPESISSWRGSYDLPALTYSSIPLLGKHLVQILLRELAQSHIAYKGGEYRYSAEDEFYVANYGRASEYKVVDHTVEDLYVILNTRIDRY